MRMRTLRLLAAACALALAGCGAAATRGRPDQDATLLLDAPRAAVHAGIASALARGYDEAEGVHLRLRRARPGTDAAKALRTGPTDPPVPGPHEPGRHPDLVAVMAIVQRPLLAVDGPRAADLGPKPWGAALRHALGRPDGRLTRRDIAPGGTPGEALGEPVYPELVLAVPRQTLTDSPGLVRG